jgi:hypothetical protein
MKITRASFRLILLLSQCFIPLAVWIHFLTRASLPAEFQTYLRHQHSHPLSLHDRLFTAFGSIYLLLYTVCFVGLFLFRPFSRKLFVVLILGGILFDPFLSLQVKSGWDVFVGDSLGVLTALILFLIYFSSLKDDFVRKP